MNFMNFLKIFLCSDKSWHELIRASQLFKFQGLMGHVKENTQAWHKFYDSLDPFEEVLPEPWDKLDRLEKIVLLRCFRLDKVSLAVRYEQWQRCYWEFRNRVDYLSYFFLLLKTQYECLCMNL